MDKLKIFSGAYRNRGLNEKQVAEMIGLSVSTLRLNRHKGVGIPYYKMGRAVRYDLKDLENFIQEQKTR